MARIPREACCIRSGVAVQFVAVKAGNNPPAALAGPPTMATGDWSPDVVRRGLALGLPADCFADDDGPELPDGPDRWASEYDASPSLRGELSKGAYLAFKRAEAAGSVKVYAGRTVK